MTPEDIGDIFQELEDALFAMAIRNMDAHKAWEEKEGFKWTQWQAEQIKGLRQYREKVNIITNKGFDEAKKGIEKFLQEAYEGSVDDAAGFAVKAGKGSISPAFFGVNSQKMDIMLEEAVKDIDTKRYACINRMNSGYTDFLRKADIFAQSGSMTIPQALDHAMKDFLSAGLNCVEYSNGNRVNIASYAEMALRTSSSEVTRQANGDVRNALDEYLVVSNVIGMTCPICQKWQGKVLIDDVYSDGKPDGKHQLVSDAKADGFMHPNCRHQLYMYLEGITEIAELPNDVETKEHYKAEQEQRRQEREIRKYKRLRDGAVDPANREKYDARVKERTAKHDQFLREHDYLRKNPKRLAPRFTGNGKPNVAFGKILGHDLNSETTAIEDIIMAKTQKGTNFVIKDPNHRDSVYGELAELVPKEMGYYDIKAHGDTNSIKIYNTVVDAEELANIINSRIDYSGEDVRLLSCYTGNTRTNECFAKELSRLIPVKVKAPTGELLATSLGRIEVPDASPYGKFAIFFKGELIGYD